MSLTTDRARAIWNALCGRDPDLPRLDRIIEDAAQITSGEMRYAKHPDLGHVLFLYPGILGDSVYLANAPKVGHEGGHAKEIARRRAGEPLDAEVRRYITARYGTAGDRLYAIAQPRWGERTFEHYAEGYMATVWPTVERIGPDLAAQLLDLGVAFPRAAVETFFAPKPVEQRIAEFWARVEALPPSAKLTAADIHQWAMNVLERDPAAKIYVDDFRICTGELQLALDEAAAT